MTRFIVTVVIAFLSMDSRVLAQPRLTFSKDVAPIVFARCASCHRPGEIGPFSLLSYAEVKQRLAQIADVTSRRIMPPWKPERGHEPFLDDRSLRDDELRILQEWIAQGGVEGDPRDLPPVPTAGAGWLLGIPDLVVEMSEPFILPASGADVFRTFVIPIPTTSSRYVRAIEFKPGSARAVHHANLGIDRTRSSRRLDLRDPAPGYTGGMVPDAAYPPGHLLGWTPGQHPRPSPEGMAWRLERESDAVVQLHMQPTGKPERIQVSIGIFFTDERPTRMPVGLRLGSETIDIPAGESQYIVSDRYNVPVDAQLLAAQPHAHNLARRMEAVAILPDKTLKTLIAITDWDFRWQDVYRYTQPIALPKGTTIAMRYEYDNSSANARNPYQPPRRVVWGQNTTDEMGDLWLQLVPQSNADLGALSADVGRKRAVEDLAAYAKLVREEPGNPLRRDALAMLYLQNGRGEEAAAEFKAALDLNPESAPGHYNLGLALVSQRKLAEASAEFQEALRLSPEYAEAHNNLGAILHAAGKLDDAERHYRLAVRFRPDNEEALNNLGRLLTERARPAEAVEQFQRALALNPEFASALAGLAWIRATSNASLRDPQEAVRLAETADRLTGHQDPSALDTLAAAHAAAGAFDRAAEAARSAITFADRLQLTDLSKQIAARLRLYERREPYISRQ